jgi:hypothetical protein
LKAVIGQLEQRTTNSKHINKLLGAFCCTHGPEATAYASGHDNYVISFICHFIHNIILPQNYIISLKYTNDID